MPLTPEQRRTMDIHLRSNTAYNMHTDGYTGRNFIIDSMERLLDSDRNMTRDLFLPNSFIDGCNSSFWFKMASIMCGGSSGSSGSSGLSGLSDWHELQYGSLRARERYVYTWTFRGDTYRFYTRVLHVKELVWYINKSTDEESGGDTDTEEIRNADITL